MKKLKNTKNLILLLIAVLLVIVAAVFMLGFAKKSENQISYNNGSEYNYDAESKIKSFAKENGLSINDWPDELIDLLKRNSETESFVLNYPLKKNLTYDINLDEYAHSSSVPLFMQWDERWGYESYGDDMIALSGCGPTCLSMVCVYLLDDTSYNPKYISEFSENNGYCVADNGSAWTLISEGGKKLGLNVEELSLDENVVMQNLQAGNPIICVMGPGDFTSSGHYIVMTDYVDGKIKINDPNSKVRSEKLWEFEDIKDQINNLWGCSVSDFKNNYSDYDDYSKIDSDDFISGYDDNSYDDNSYDEYSYYKEDDFYIE